jgi:hypothetical protein
MADNCPRCGGRLSQFMDWVLMRFFRLCRSCGWTDRPCKVERWTYGTIEGFTAQRYARPIQRSKEAHEQKRRTE